PGGARERLRDPLAARGLAVRARDADDPQAPARLLVEPAREETRPASQAAHRGMGHPPLRRPAPAAALPDDARRAAAQRLRNVVAPVVRLAGIREESVAGTHRAAVVREA